MKLSNLTKVSFCAIILACIGLPSHYVKAQNIPKTSKPLSEDINITIDKSTSDHDFEDIQSTLLTYQIVAEFSNVKRNDSEEITAIGIRLSTNNGQQVQGQMSGNKPLANISFGRKNNQLYIEQGRDDKTGFNLWHHSNPYASTFDNDSIFSSHFKAFKDFNIDDFFNNKSAVFMFNGDSLTIEELKDKMMQDFSFKNPAKNRFSFLFNDDFDTSNGRYQFIDDPKKEKIIIIDGKVSTFETLDHLAKADKIDQVDILKPETAMSIYGEKARDGAIIVTTK